MATVAAIFDDSVAMEKAISALQSAGLGDDITRVDEGRDADTAPERTEIPDDSNDAGIVVPLGGAVGGTGGGTGMPGAVPLLGGSLSGNDDGVSGPLSDLGDEGEPFRLAAEHGGKLIVLKTDEVDAAVQTLQQAGAQQIYDPR